MPASDQNQLEPEQFEEIYQKLPEDLKTALFSEINALFIRQAAAKFKLPEDKIPDLADEVGSVILGITPLEQLATNIQETLDLDAPTAQAIAQDIDFKIFSPIRLTLRKIRGQATVEEFGFSRPTMPIRSIAPAPTLPAQPRQVPPLTQRPIPSLSPAIPSRPSPAPPGTLPTQSFPRPAVPTTRPPLPNFPARPAPIPPPVSGTSRPVTPAVPQPFIPSRPSGSPNLIIPRTITPPFASNRPSYESPTLNPRPISPFPSASAPAAAPAKPIAPPAAAPTPIPPRPAAEPMITSKPLVPPPTEPIDLTKANHSDPRMESNIVDLKNLE